MFPNYLITVLLLLELELQFMLNSGTRLVVIQGIENRRGNSKNNCPLTFGRIPVFVESWNKHGLRRFFLKKNIFSVFLY